MNIKRKIFNLYEMIAFMLITAIVASLTCGFIMFKIYDSKKVKTDYTALTSNKNLIELIDNYNQITDKYYKKVDQSKLVDSAIKGMLEYLGEPYTEYMEENESNGFNEQLHGTYEGIGVEISTNKETNEIFVNRVFPDSPASEAGVMVGDIFLKLNGEDIKDKTMIEISEQIKYGKEPTSNIVFLRDGKEVELVLTRKQVKIISGSGRVIDYRGKKVGYLLISTFASPTSEQVKEVIQDFQSKGIKELIIDVRGNTGGYLDSTVKIAEQFIEKGKTILYLESKNGKDAVVDSTEAKTDFKIVVLVDKISASASEILAAALRDSYGAKLVGTQTFGKGRFQETGQLSSGASIKYTAGLWYTPENKNIDGIGLTPDYEIKLNEKYAIERTDANDNQLQKALEVVTSK